MIVGSHCIVADPRSLGMSKDTDQASIQFVATRLRTIRTHHNLTQEELAGLVGCSEKFIQQIEAARKKQIWLSTVGLLAASVGLRVDEFLAPELPVKRKLPRKVASSRVHRKS